MSTYPTKPSTITIPSDATSLPMTLPRIVEHYRRGDKLVMVTAYDYPSARAAEAAGVDLVLVGDSGAMTVLGHESTVPVTLDELLMLAKAVRRGLSSPFLVGDLPFGSYEVSDEQAIHTAMRFVKEAGVDAVKLEGCGPMAVARARAITQAGIPVMGHVGLTPQTAVMLGGYRAQAKDASAAMSLIHGAEALEDAGCFSVVLEAIPSVVANAVVERLSVPTIGIGAGPTTAGQVLVFHDLLGIREGRGGKFVQRYADLQDAMDQGVAAYAADVRSKTYPGPEHEYAM
ncbi:MAG: 3-methyl-2-oxobutanoate hydroxymethyltransferase, partial [Solirubrobacteraceae bacterium]|nr:3-methyl-2-oxobutanoate hydroxymethyltransferase [Solirubrobacteraceae bacterium]